MMLYRYTTAVFLSMGAAYLGLCIADRTPPTEFHKVEALAHGRNGTAYVRVRFSVLRHRQCLVDGQRTLFDAGRNRWILDPVHLDRAPGPIGVDTYTTTISLPPNIEPGLATMEIVNRYQCNFTHAFWPIIAPTITVTFNVSPGA